ncbi:hypothetical protein PMAYCL1PPCAC_15615, partial [Pristionchus mayeri]
HGRVLRSLLVFLSSLTHSLARPQPATSSIKKLRIEESCPSSVPSLNHFNYRWLDRNIRGVRK